MRASASLTQWKSVPKRLRLAVRGLKGRQLDQRGGSEGWTIREYAHHLVEANLVASAIIIAAIGRPGCSFDWSWLIPDESWMRALGYERVPLDPAIRLLDALSAHIASLLQSSPARMRRSVDLVSGDGAPQRTTVSALLAAEVSHANHHLVDIAAIRRK